MSEIRISPNGGETSEDNQPLLNTTWLASQDRRQDNTISVVFCVIMVALGSIQFGYSFGYSSPSQSQLMEDLGLTLTQYSLFGSLVNVGAMAGAIASAITQSKSCGRRGSLMVAAAPSILGWVAISFTKEAAILYIGRLLVGFGIGIISYTVPIYIAEIAPPDSRGTLGSANQLGIVVGMLLVYLLGTFLHWRVLAVIGIFPCLALLPGLYFVPESPWWLAKVGKDFEGALQALGCDTDSEANHSLREMATCRILDPYHPRSKLRQRRNTLPLMLASGLLMLQQLSGINALLFYSSYIFEKAGISNGNLATLGLGVVQVVATTVATWLIDKAGRRVLLIVSASGMTLSLLLAAVSFYIKSAMSSDSNWYNIICVLSFAGIVGMVTFYSIGIGPIPWLIMSEILPIEIKNFAGNVTILAKFFASWVITMTSILLISWSKTGAFSIYAAFCALTVIVASLWVPETRGKTLEEIRMFFC